jgi:hypothetical protein
MRGVIAVTVQLVKEMLTANQVETLRPVSRDRESACEECDCDCYECRARQPVATR